MKQALSDQESHALYCPIKNVKSALFVVAFFCLTTFLSWKGLDKPPAHYSLTQLLLVAIFAVAVVVPWLVEFTCARERLILVLLLISVLTTEVQGFAPSVLSKRVELVKSGELALALIGLFVSLTMLVQAIRSRGAVASNAGAGGTPLDS